MDTTATAYLIELKDILTDRRDNQRIETNKLSAHIRELEKLITPKAVEELNEKIKIEETWRIKSPVELREEHNAKVMKKFLESK